MMADAGPLLSYREEGGIGGARPALVVSRGAVAGLRLGRCHTSYRLGPRRWRRLRVSLHSADLASIAGSYPPIAGAADTITYVVRSGGREVRVAPAPLPRNEAVLAQLGPLLTVIGNTIAAGERRLPANCSSTRVPQGAPGGGAG